MFDHREIEQKWQKRWIDDNLYQAHNMSDKKKFYCLDMFPYPSGEGLHAGHVVGYSASDIYARYMRAKGYEVLHPIGWDAFGLPAENFAIKQGIHPHETTQKAIGRFKSQLKKTGLSYDWSREIDTSSPEYYKWTQWLFLLMYRNGLAYRKMAPVNWCPKDQTVLANEQVIKKDDKNICERCGTEVVQKDLEQWFFRMNDYSQKLLDGLDTVDWPESTKSAQKNWIGRQEGLTLKWKLADSDLNIETFTKYPETIFGATFLTVAPEYKDIWKIVKTEHIPEVEKYIDEAKKKTHLQRAELQKDKSGVFTGSYVINPVTKEQIPVWVADYVMADYGSGAVFGCPGHDDRDFQFAHKYKLPIKRVLKSADGDESQITSAKQVVEEGTMVNSEFLNGLNSRTDAKEAISKEAEKKGFGVRTVFYNLRDWLISRQRYWGAPIPVVYCPHCAHEQETGECCGENCGCDHGGNHDHGQEHAQDKHDENCECGGDCDCGCEEDTLDITMVDGKKYAIIPIPEDQLPVLLPTDVDFRPTGESPLTRSKSFHTVTCPRCGAKHGVKREVDTMDTFVDSSWYFLRFADPHNDTEFASQELLKKWLPVDLYIGGDHATTHLIYARFLVKALYDFGYLTFDEPFLKMRYLGLLLGEDGRKMSKRWGNVVNPDAVIEAYGADTMRTYEMFMGPFELSKAWSTAGIEGVRRFYNRVWILSGEVIESGRKTSSKEIVSATHKLIKKVGEDIEGIKFNTAIAAMMEYLNLAQDKKSELGSDSLAKLIKVLSPFGPFLTEELWEKLGYKHSVHSEPWPEYDESQIAEEMVVIPVQINGKLRFRFEFTVDEAEDEELVTERILSAENMREYMKGKKIINKVYVKGKIFSLVIS